MLLKYQPEGSERKIEADSHAIDMDKTIHLGLIRILPLVYSLFRE